MSESGAGYTWAGNSRENQLTPWSNDPVSDPPGEALYVRDDDSGELWSPTAQPIRCPDSTYIARHGAGYSRFQHLHGGIQLDLSSSCCPTTPVKMSVLTVENRSGRPRRLSLTAYAEWVLGTSRGDSAPWIVTECEPETEALLATNPWNTEFGGRVAFLDMGGRQTAWTADRTEFLGRNGGPERPAGSAPRTPTAAAPSAAGLDPCAALQTSFELADGESTEVVVSARRRPRRGEAAIDLIRQAARADHAPSLARSRGRWDDVQATIQVRTPDRSLDIMLNGWLVYQTLACRLWARAALYQAGGAYGFRDQLQDVIALIVPQPAAGPRAPAPGGRSSVRRGRRPALVASAVRPRRPHPHLRRPAVVALRRRPLPRRHRRPRRARRACSVPRGRAAAARRSTTPTSSPSSRREQGNPVRALRRGDRLQPRRRGPRAAVDRRRRLERRHEPRRREGSGRERLAGLVPVSHARRVRPDRRVARRRGACRPLAGAHGRPARRARGARLGRRLVSTRLLRRRHAARLGEQRRVPDRLDRPIVERAVGRRRPRRGRSGRWPRSTST